MRELLSCAMDIGEQMLISGAEVHRVEDSMGRICRALGACRTDCFIITSSMVVTVHFDEDKVYTETRRINSVLTDFDKLDKLNALSRRICSEGMSCAEIRAQLQIIKGSKGYSFPLQCLVYAVIAGAFTAFFGGDLIQMLISAVIGCALRFVCDLADRTVNNIVFSKFISSLTLTVLSYLFLWIGAVPRVDEIIIGNIMLIIPGLGFTNALRDLFTGDSIAGALRSLEAVLSAVSIAAGYVLFVFVRGGVSVGEYSDGALPAIQIIGAFLGSLGFAVLFNIKGGKLIATAIGGGLGWTVYLCLGFVIADEAVRYFLVAMLISLYAEIMARALRAPATVFIAPSLIPLVPGASLYYTMAYALDGGGAMFLEKATSTVILAASLAIGVIVSAVAIQIYLKILASVRYPR